MSVKVDLAKLAEALSDFASAYLVTVGDDYRAHTVAVDPRYLDGRFEIAEMGRHTRANVTGHADVSLIWPPRESGGYTLIVDGTGHATDDALHVMPTRAVLHRRASADSPSTSPDCLHDCVPLKK
jgi:hypothetical protein